MTQNGVSKTAQLARDKGLVLGFPKRFASGQLVVNGTEYTGATAAAFVQTRITAATNVATTRAAYQAAVKAADAVENATAATVSGMVEVVYAAFGDDPAALADFGLPVRKKGTLTPAERLAANEKAAATRKARHTMGAKQKLAITGATAPVAAAPAVSAGVTGVTAVTPAVATTQK